jgi:AmmeMemoRadiSam system protein A
VVERLWGGDETLLVVSSDLSHYLGYDQAQERDWHTAQRIMACVQDLHGDEACGAVPLNGALRAAQRHHLVPRLLDLRNSADTAGGAAARVVGYAAVAFEDAAGFRGAERAVGHAVLSVARSEIAQALGVDAPTPVLHPRLHERAASFVTLHDARGQLRGCVGQLEATQALGEDVRRHALGAAFGDSRFDPLTAAEWQGLDIEVSVLGPLQPLPAAATLDDAAALLQPGVDGVVLAWQGRRGTFLPQVWQQLPDRREFLRALLRKAGLSPDFWDPGIRLWRYAVTVYHEPRDERPH